AASFTVAAPASATAGSAFTLTVTAKDAFGNTATGYLGTVHITKSDGGAGSAAAADHTVLGRANRGRTRVHTAPLPHPALPPPPGLLPPAPRPLPSTLPRPPPSPSPPPPAPRRGQPSPSR